VRRGRASGPTAQAVPRAVSPGSFPGRGGLKTGALGYPTRIGLTK
jgi:hypothetical protein